MERDATVLLNQLAAGDRKAADRLWPLVYDELRKMAGALMAAERSDHTLQRTALVHEAFVKLIDTNRMQIAGKSHFVRLAVQAMRRILVDHARTKGRHKRGGGERASMLDSLDEPAAPEATSGFDLVELNEALLELAELSPRQAQLVELRFFGGLSEDEAGNVLGVSRRSASLDWAAAKAWLRRRVEGEASES